MIDISKDYNPVNLDGVAITFFDSIYLYGTQREMEESERISTSVGIV